MIDTDLRRLHWQRTRRLAAAAAALAAGCAILPPLLAALAPDVHFLRFPLGYIVVAVAPAVVMVVAYFMVSAAQERLDRQHGLTNEF